MADSCPLADKASINQVRRAAPAAFFLAVLSPDAQEPNGLIYLAYVGAAVLALGNFTLGVGLLKGGG
jgi:hypothetical protein